MNPDLAELLKTNKDAEQAACDHEPGWSGRTPRWFCRKCGKWMTDRERLFAVLNETWRETTAEKWGNP